jgi:hypothetical protein
MAASRLRVCYSSADREVRVMEMVPSSAQVAELNRTWGDRVIEAEERKLAEAHAERVIADLGTLLERPIGLIPAEMAEAAGIPLRRVEWDESQPILESDLFPLEQGTEHTSGYIRHGKTHYFEGDPFRQPPGETVMYIDGGEIG